MTFDNKQSDAYEIIDSLYGRGHGIEVTVDRLENVLGLTKHEAVLYMLLWGDYNGVGREVRRGLYEVYEAS